MAGTLFAASLARLLIGISVQVVVMNMLGSVLSMSSVGDSIKSTVGNKVPTGLGLVGKHQVAAILPSEPSVHFLGEIPNLIGRLLVHPMVKWAVELIATVGRDLLRELTFEAGEHIVERKSVSGEMNPL